ncbi:MULTISPECIES: kynureninase [Nocardioides]|uniref:Kynureninase n=1 Tax=Nocardioides vastitatis TaxID=2568655 RepID=A0ABW0ZI30_9ACTN|nr:kynureninase [Nocardioides sp.]THJ04988.1 kynureninase [Nocardioides sp.]
MTRLDDLTGPSNALAPHYSRFRVAERLLLTGHSHQAWPDVAARGQLEAYDDAAAEVDDKWERALGKADVLRAGFRRLLGDPEAEIALGASTHELVVRLLSALDLRNRPRLVTTDGEFHSARRQLARLAEEGVDVVRVPTAPVTTLVERMSAAVDDRTAAVLVSSVLFETSWRVPHLSELAARCERVGVELLVDAYHHLGVLPFSIADLGLERAWVVGGGYKYLQLGEGNCFLRLPPQADRMRPVVTGWYAEFGDLSHGAGSPDRLPYAAGAARFAGSTYDPTSHYRAARVLDFFEERGLTPELLREVSLHQRGVLAAAFDDLGAPDPAITRDRETPPDGFGGFLTLHTPHAGRLRAALRRRGVLTDSRGRYLRLGPAPYLTDDQLKAAVGLLGEVLAEERIR